MKLLSLSWDKPKSLTNQRCVFIITSWFLFSSRLSTCRLCIGHLCRGSLLWLGLLPRSRWLLSRGFGRRRWFTFHLSRTVAKWFLVKIWVCFVATPRIFVFFNRCTVNTTAALFWSGWWRRVLFAKDKYQIILIL